MLCLRFALAVGFIAVLVLPSLGDDYFKDGKLTATLVVEDLQGGFAGLTGKRYTIEPGGAWRIEAVLPGDKLELEAKGALTRENLAVVAKALAEINAKSLANEGKEDVNPRVIRVKFGDKTSELYLPTGAELPQPDEKTAAGRFAAIARIVQRVLR
jgi:hypothetical protein